MKTADKVFVAITSHVSDIAMSSNASRTFSVADQHNVARYTLRNNICRRVLGNDKNKGKHENWLRNW